MQVKVEVQAQQKAQIEGQATAQARVMVIMPLRYVKERDEIQRQHELQNQAVKKREASVVMYRAAVEEQKCAQIERKAMLNEEVQKLRKTNQEFALTATQVKQQIKEAEERELQREGVVQAWAGCVPPLKAGRKKC
ncbi:unnamed protein product [Peronospora farinosa]|uniref:Uncharacterized protein n=1 Tax=Peronospora farinosa TaxID=134698 RepID=A0AAV0THV3_9STRA|nr:unnamed protein product [Peronospora farinosa]CAI5722214.1 unnamed protein product [Peronospora farinosa]